MKIILQIDAIMAWGEKALAVLLFCSLVALMLFNIIARNVFQTSVPKIMEIVPALVVWLAFLGGTLAFRHQRHIRLELFLRFCSSRIRTLSAILTSLFGMIVMLILFIASLEFLHDEIAFFGSWGWCRINFPIFFAICTFRFFVQLLTTIFSISTLPTTTTKTPENEVTP